MIGDRLQTAGIAALVGVLSSVVTAHVVTTGSTVPCIPEPALADTPDSCQRFRITSAIAM